MTAELVKSDLIFRAFFRDIWLSEQFLYWKKCYFIVAEFLERQIYAFVAKLSDRCFCWFPAAMLVPIRMGTNMASPYRSQKFGEKASPHILHKKNCCDLNLGESLCTGTFFLFSDSGLNLLNGFDFYLDLF